MARALYDLEGSDQGLSTDAVDRRGEQVRDEGLAGLAGKLSVLLGRRILLHADQFEEMFTTCPAGERAEFLDRVLPAANVDDVPYRLVCTLRADFLRPLLEHADVGPRLQDRLLPLSPMGVATLERAVNEPARVRGVNYDDGLATLTGHTDTVYGVAFSPNGHTLASSSDDDTVRLWNVTDPRHPTALTTLTGHTDTVYGVAFSPNGHTLASGSDDNTVRLWDTDPNEAAKNICSLIITHLTPAQWQQYIPDLPYKRPC